MNTHLANPQFTLANAGLLLQRLRRQVAFGALALTSLAGINPAGGAIAFDSAVSKSAVNAASVTWSHTVGTGTSTILVVGLATEDTSSSVLNVASITYNGVALTAVPNSAATAGSSTLDKSQLFYLLNPAAGAHTVAVTFGGAVNGVSAGSISLSGVAQSAPSAAAINTATSGTTISANIAVSTAGSWLVDAANSGAGNATLTPGASQTKRWGIGQSSSGGAGSTESVSSAGTASASWTASSSSQLALSVAAFAPSTGGATAPTITTQPASQTVTAGSSVTFSVVASGTAPLSYQWKFNGANISGATSSSFTIASAQSANAGSYTVTVSNSAGSVTSAAATLTVNSGGSNTRYNLTGFATVSPGCTGGGVIATTDPAYAQVTTPLQLATAIAAANKTAGAIKVIEIMNDLDLGWNEVGSAVQTLASTPFRAHNPPQLHPVLLVTGMSLCDIKPKSGLTIFSANGATIRHCNFNIKSCNNIIVRNLKFDENWEWDEATKGNYDKNDWDFITIGNGGSVANVWIDHCTFTKSYDGLVDQKAGTSNVTFSWCRYVGDDGATNPNSWVRQQINALEANRSAYPFYNFLRSNGFSLEDIVQIIQAHDKTHLAGSNDKDPNNATLAMTFHHQLILGVWDRCVPRLRAGNVHNYNLYVDDSDVLVAKRLRDLRASAMSSANQNTLNNTYSFNPPINGSISTEGGALLVEKCVYEDCLWPLRNNQTDVTDPTYTGKILALDTIYDFLNADGTTTVVRGNSTDAGNPLGPFQAPIIAFSWNLSGNQLPYTYTVDDPAGLLPILQAGAGAGVLTWSKDNWLKTSY